MPKLPLITSLLLLLLAPLGRAAEERLDVRVVLDNTPAAAAADRAGLRLRAVRALADWLPVHARAEVLVVGAGVSTAIALGPVDSRWRQRARDLTLAEPSGPGSIADSLAALAAAPALGADVRRHLVVLSEGLIELTENSGWNRALRQSLLSETLPQFAAAGTRIHTLGFSPAADVELLSTLALVSGGQHVLATDWATAEPALRSGLGILARTEQVAVQGQPFAVPPGTRDLHLLLTGQGRLRPELETPQGQRIKAELPGPNLRWYQEDGLLMASVSNPPAGTWQVHPEPGQALELRVLADPAFHVGELPTTVRAGFAQRLDLALQDAQGRVVDDPRWLDLLEPAARLASPGAAERPLPVKPVHKPADGIWWIDLAGFGAPGSYRVALNLQAPTFSRALSRDLLVDAALVLVLTAVDGVGLLTLDLAPQGLEPDSVQLIARVVQPDTRMVMVPAMRRGNRHELTLKPPVPGAEQLRPGFAVDLTIRGRLLDGSSFELRPDRLEVPWPFPDAPVPLRLSIGHPAFPALPVALPDAAVAEAPSVATQPEAPVGFGAPQPDAAQAPQPDVATEALADPAPGADAEVLPVAEEPLLPHGLVVALIVGNNLLIVGVGILLFRRKPTVPEVAGRLEAAMDAVMAAREEAASGNGAGSALDLAAPMNPMPPAPVADPQPAATPRAAARAPAGARSAPPADSPAETDDKAQDQAA